MNARPFSPEEISRLRALLATARGGDPRALGQILDTFRAPLREAAGRQLDRGLWPKKSPSDLVQETFLEAHRDFPRFRGNTPEELLDWLQRILANNCVSAARLYRGNRKRDLAREHTVAGEDPGVEDVELETPSPIDRAARNEEAAVLEHAVADLPELQRLVVRLRHWEKCTFRQIGERLGRSEEAVRKLWVRAICRLERDLDTLR